LLAINGHNGDAGEIKMEVDPIQDMEIDPALLNLSPRQVKRPTSAGNASTNGNFNGTSNPDSPVSARHSSRASKPVDRFIPQDSTGLATSPRRSIGSMNGAMSMSPPGSAKSYKGSFKALSPTLPLGMTPEEEASYLMALQLQQEQFGLRNRRSGN
jgi:hypothetical protein